MGEGEPGAMEAGGGGGEEGQTGREQQAQDVQVSRVGLALNQALPDPLPNKK